MSRRVRNRRRGGFTLLEVMVALAILATSIVAIMQLFPHSLLQARMAAERTITAQLADATLGQIRQSSAAAVFYNRIPQHLINVYQVYGLYQDYSTTVERLTSSSEVFLQRVTFTVSFAEDRHEKFVTFISQQ